MSMAELRNLILPLASLFSLERMIRRTGKVLIFPFYHLISDAPPPHIRHLYRVKGIVEFKKDIEDLLRYFEPASPELLLNNNPPKQHQKPAFILSFDDGLSEVKRIVAPILESKGINAIFFLNNNFIGNQGLFYRYKVSLLLEALKKPGIGTETLKKISGAMGVPKFDRESLAAAILKIGYDSNAIISVLATYLEVDFENYLSVHRPYMNDEEISRLIQKGFFVGGHSLDHPSFHSLDDGAQIEEIERSVKGIKERFDLSYSLFSFPFSDTGTGSDVFRRLYDSKSGFLDASFGTSGLKEDEPYPHYQRIPLEKSGPNAEKYLKSEYFYYILKSLAGRNRIIRQTTSNK